MKKFVLLIFLFLMCFLFMIPGASFAGIVPGVGQTIEQTAASSNLTNSGIIMNYFCNDAKSDITGSYLISRHNPGMTDNQATLKNIKESRIVLADNTPTLENGTVLKCPFSRL